MVRVPGITSLIGNTPLVEVPGLSPNPAVKIWAKLEGSNPTGSLKDRIARSMIEDAQAKGLLSGDKILLEPTSGNTGISLAFLAMHLGLRVLCVMPDSATEERRHLIQMFGAEVHYSPGDKGSNGAIEVAKEMAEDDKFVMLYQYGNEANPRAHEEGTGPEILRDLPELTHFVAGLGTGGTLTGVGRYLKKASPEVQIVAAEPEQGEAIYGLRSLDDGFRPPVLDESVLDSKIKVSALDSVKWTQKLAAEFGHFVGISSGATVHVARRIAERIESGNIVCLFADGGWKYLSTNIWSQSAEQAAEEVENMPW